MNSQAQLFTLLGKLKKDPDLFDEIIKSWESEGIIEPVSNYCDFTSSGKFHIFPITQLSGQIEKPQRCVLCIIVLQKEITGVIK